MSDETPPPPLRLKPRQRSDSEPPPEPPVAAAPEEGKLRLKPKLNLQPEPEPEPEPVAEVAPPPPPPEPEPEPTPPPPPMPEESRGKLKIKLPGAAAAAQEPAAPPVLDEPEVPPSLPPFPVVAPPPPEEEIGAPPLLPEEVAKRTAAPFKGKIPPGGSRPAVFIRPKVPAALLAAERRRRLIKYAAIAVLGVFLAGAVIGGAYLKFTEPPPPTRLPPKPMPVPEPVVVAPPPVPVATKAAPVIEPQPVDAASGIRVASTATVELSPGVLGTTEAVKAVPNASSAFRSFVANTKISGVYQGNPPRAFINGRLVHTGEMVDDALEIYFDSIDIPARSLVFKDSRGATVSRRY